MAGAIALSQGNPSDLTPIAGKTMLAINASEQLVLIQPDGTITPIISGAPIYSQFNLNAAQTDIIIEGQTQTSIVNVGGSARTAKVIIDRDGAVNGGNLTLRLEFAAVSGIIVEFRDGDAAGPLLDTFTTDGTVANGVWQFYFALGQWNELLSKVPAS